MLIPDNIISKKLNNVFLIIGGSCSGKTTMAKYLNEKHGMYHYDTDKMLKTYYETASIEYQPTMCRKMKDIFEYTIDEVIEYDLNVIKEATPMIITDLIEISGKYEKIICEGIYAYLIAPLIDYDKKIHLSTSNEIIRNDYFSRSAQTQILESINNRLDISNFEKERRINHRLDMVCEVVSRIEDEINKQDIKQYYRNEKITIIEMFNIVENHFRLK